VVADIDEFETETDRQLAQINTTLEDLKKLEEILGDLDALNSDLEQAEEDIQDSIDERSTKKEDEERVMVINLLLIIVLILLVINMILTVVVGRKIKSVGKDTMLEQGGYQGGNPPVAQQVTPSQDNEFEETGPTESELEEQRSPPRPPSK
jgi:hypothetical protein